MYYKLTVALWTNKSDAVKRRRRESQITFGSLEIFTNEEIFQEFPISKNQILYSTQHLWIYLFVDTFLNLWSIFVFVKCLI